MRGTPRLTTKGSKTMIQLNKLPLLIIVLALSNLTLPAPVRATDISDVFTMEGKGTGNASTTGLFDSAFGAYALHNVTTGYGDTASGYVTLFSNTTGYSNTATGDSSLYGNTTGSNNTGDGALTLESNVTGGNNAAIGARALRFNTTGSNNTASGAFALNNNSTASFNTATGNSALYSNTTGSSNTATGTDALYSNATGDNNLANGFQSLYSNTTGASNMATGTSALAYNTTGSYNMANGSSALFNNTTGGYNVAEGTNALFRNKTGDSNIAIGTNAGSNIVTGSGNIDIGNLGVTDESKTIRLGTQGSHANTYIAGISRVAVAGGVGVMIDTNGHLGTAVSSARFKEGIKPMDKASETILSLKPVTFRYKKELDPKGIAQFGLVAEEVEKVDPDLVARDEKGKAYTVRYEAVNAMLLNEFLKEHKKVEEQQQKEQTLEAMVVQQQKQIEALTAGLRKVSTQLATQKSSATIVAAAK
jgi:hypothetical protein